eukprot:7142658-Pyramimonas_sp.AAC.1
MGHARERLRASALGAPTGPKRARHGSNGPQEGPQESPKSFLLVANMWRYFKPPFGGKHMP